MSPLISVPQDELRTERINLPDGHYQADFMGGELVGNDADWRAIKAKFENFTRGGETMLPTTFKGREVTIDLASRTHSTAYTVESSNGQAKQIGAREIARLAQALGAASQNGDGQVTVEGDTAEEVLATLNEKAGTRVNLSIRNKPRKRNKVVQVNEKGETIVDDEIARVWPVEAE